MPSRWSQRRGQHSCRWSLLLLLGLLKLFGIAEVLTLAEMTTDISSLLVNGTKVTSRMGENVPLYCKADFLLPGLSYQVSWYHISQHGRYTLVRNYPFEVEGKPVEFQRHTLLSSRHGVVVLLLKDVRLQDSGTYKCVVKNNQHSVERYVILQVTAPKEASQENEDSVVIYAVVGFLSVALVVWMISLCVLCKRGEL
ncbi:uncharacterized protein LOC144456765 [Phascolarctos cinereus]